MLCTLCNRHAQQVIRVDSWLVCNWCVSNKVLEQAIDVRTNIKKLTAAVAGARITHQRDTKRVKEAQGRLQDIYEDLALAIKHLAEVSEDSQKSLATSLDEVEALKKYRDTEAEKTRKARKRDD